MDLLRSRYIFVFLVCGFFASTVGAYVLPSAYLLKELSLARQKYKVSDMRLEFTDSASEDLKQKELLYLKVPERLRWVSKSKDQSIYVEKEGRSASGEEKKMKTLSALPNQLLAKLMMVQGEKSGEDSARLKKTLAKYGVDTEVVSLGRDGDYIVYIIGARPWEKDKPQIWLLKKNFLPRRTILKVDGDWFDMRFLNYGGMAQSVGFPETIEVYRNGSLSRRLEMADIRTNENLPETLFLLPGE